MSAWLTLKRFRHGQEHCRYGNNNTILRIGECGCHNNHTHGMVRRTNLSCDTYNKRKDRGYEMRYELKGSDQTIIDMWNDNKKGSDIAEALGMSRNAVMGKLYRLRAAKYIEYRTVPVRQKTDTPEKRAKRETRAYKYSSPYSGPVIPLPPQPEMVSNDYGIKLTELKNSSCRFIINDGPAHGFLFCGKKKEKGPYCAEHRKLCYIKVQPRKRTGPDGKRSMSQFVLKNFRVEV